MTRSDLLATAFTLGGDRLRDRIDAALDGARDADVVLEVLGVVLPRDDQRDAIDALAVARSVANMLGHARRQRPDESGEFAAARGIT